MNRLMLCVLLLVSGCSTLNKTMFTSALIGGAVGGVGGSTFSPDEDSVNKNAYMFSILGAVAGAGLSYIFYPRPEVKSKKSLLLDNEPSINKDIPLFDFAPELKGIKPEVNFKPVNKYEVPLEKLPKALEGKVKKQYIIEYEAESRTLNVGNRTIEISPFKAWEHVYEE